MEIKVSIKRLGILINEANNKGFTYIKFTGESVIFGKDLKGGGFKELKYGR